MTQENKDDVMDKTQEVFTSFVNLLSETKPEKRAVFLASEMLLTYIAVDMGMGFEDMMQSLATNMPQFYKRWHDTQEKTNAKPGVVIDMQSLRRKGKDQQ